MREALEAFSAGQGRYCELSVPAPPVFAQALRLSAGGGLRFGSRALALRLGALLLAYVARGGGVRAFGGIELHAFQIGTLRGVLACRGSGMFVVVHPTYYSEVARSRPTLRSIFTAQAPLRCHAVARTVRQPSVPFALSHRAAFVSKTPALATEKLSFIPSTRYFVAFGQNVKKKKGGVPPYCISESSESCGSR